MFERAPEGKIEFGYAPEVMVLSAKDLKAECGSQNECHRQVVMTCALCLSVGELHPLNTWICLDGEELLC